MSASPVEVTRTTTLWPSRDGRLAAYGAAALASFAAALVLGEPGIAPLGVPFAVALALGLRRTGPVEVQARVVLDAEQVLEGDPIEGRLVITWPGRFDARAVIHRLRGLASAVGTEPTGRAQGAERIEVPFRVSAVRWGRHTVGEVWLRLTVPFGLLSWTGKIMTGPAVRVLPGAERLNQLLSPTRSRTVWGMHTSTRIGDGHEFAELRPYAPGDRVRDLNWAATARHRRPIVNRHHPEVSGDVVIALDAHDDGSLASREVLTRAARIAWALVTVHMRANDRVGLVGLGGSTQWLPPAGGRLAKYQLLETLLSVGGEAADRVETRRRRVDVPSSALVIAVTTLHDERTLETLTSWRARGRAVAVAAIDAAVGLDPSAAPAERLANRLWSLELERRVWELRRVGVNVVRAPVDGAITPVVSALRRARRASWTRRA